MITYLQKSRKATIFSPSNYIPCLEHIKSLKTWALLSGDHSVVTECPDQYPAIWATIDTGINRVSPGNNWPSPAATDVFTNTTNVSAEIITVLSDSTKGIYLQIENCRGIIIDKDPLFTAQQLRSPLKENVELLIAFNLSIDKVLLLRSAIRPRFVITNVKKEQQLGHLSNIIYLENSEKSVTFHLHNHKQILKLPKKPLIQNSSIDR